MYARLCATGVALHGLVGFEWETGCMGFKKIPGSQGPSRLYYAVD